MAVYKIFPEKDATLYSAFPIKNTGIDQIIEVSTTSDGDASRFLTKFSTTEISNVIDTIISGSVTDITGSLLTSSREFQSNLRCFLAHIDGVDQDITIETYPVSESWVMGTGKYQDDPQTTNGCNWAYKNGNNQRWATASFSSGVTASFPHHNPGGGAWYTASIDGLSVGASQSFEYPDDKDLNIDVTNVIRLINSGSLVNEGFIVKRDKASEFVTLREGASNVKYFSIDTHTIYPPYLEFKWRDYTFNTGSSTNTIINTSKLVATLDNNGKNFRKDSVHKFYINCRPQFPTRVFQTSSLYTTNYYLPTSSYYAIKDLDTNEFIINFDNNCTQISADENGSYFKLYMNGLEPERYYQILVKVNINGETLILDDNYYFKVING